jgi:hypothetical protein
MYKVGSDLDSPSPKPPKKSSGQLGRFFRGDFGHTYYSHIYAIGPKDGGNIKFGQATNVNSRLSSIQTGSPVRLKLHGTVYLPFDTEFAIHEHLKDHRSHGEWFYPTMETMRILDLIRTKQPAELLRAIGLFKYLPESFVQKVNFEENMALPPMRAPPQMSTHADLLRGYTSPTVPQPK